MWSVGTSGLLTTRELLAHPEIILTVAVLIKATVYKTDTLFEIVEMHWATIGIYLPIYVL